MYTRAHRNGPVSGKVSAPAQPARPAPAPAVAAPAPTLAGLDARIDSARRFGHSLERWSRPAPASSPVQGEVIQAQLNWKASKDKEVDSLVETYNKAVGKKFFFGAESRKTALGHLHALETHVFHWFDANKSPDLDESPKAQSMKYLMNELQRERIDLVERSIKEKDEAPPIASFDSLNEENQKKVSKIWNNLLANQGIEIHETGDELQVSKPQKGFRTKVLTDFSRLLETEAGRGLVGGIMEAGGGLRIKPTTLASGKFAARPDDYEAEALRAIDPPKELEQDDYVPLNLNELSNQQKIGLLHNARALHPNKKGFSLTDNDSTQHFAFGKGSTSSLRLPVDAQDALPHPTSRAVDKEGNEIISPTFINLGHELGHVLRSLHGVSADEDTGPKLLRKAFPDQDPEEWGRVEELFNIQGVENQLRQQSGITARYGHGNLMLLQGDFYIKRIEKILSKASDLKNQNPSKEAQTDLGSFQNRTYELQEKVQNFLKHGGDSVQLRTLVDKMEIDFGELRQTHKPKQVEKRDDLKVQEEPKKKENPNLQENLEQQDDL